MQRELVYNALQTPDGTILESLYRNDYKGHKDSKTGKLYIVDGGLDYLKRSCNGDETDLSVYSDEPHEKVRKYAYRSGYGKNGDEDFQITRICSMNNEYLDKAIEYCKDRNTTSTHYQILLNEKEYRKQYKLKY